MTILIDPPTWTAHGTTWSHLVSDVSLSELHDFASRNGIPRRGFDLDHYDVPTAKYDDLVAAGAVPVTGKELISRLQGSGLRVRGKRRHRQQKIATFTRWNLRFPETPMVGWELAGRWNEPHRTYHGLDHLNQVLDAVAVLKEPTEDTALVELALWFHDAVYNGDAGQDEQLSAELAVELLHPLADKNLAGLTPGDAEEVARLIVVTKDHDPVVGDRMAELVCDADLSILGSSPAEYVRYADKIRQEYAYLSEEDFRGGRKKVLHTLLEHHTVYRTTRGEAMWETQARVNLLNEIENHGVS